MTNGSPSHPPEPRSHLVARWVSALGHPFVLIVAFVLGGSFSAMPWQRAVGITALVVIGGIGPLVFYLLRLVRQGRSNFDVSARELRGPVYGLGLGLGVLLIAATRFFGAPIGVLVAMSFALIMVMVAALINFRLKVSLHCAFAIWVSIGWFGLEPAVGYSLLVLTAGVVWSRLHLKRHSPAEVATGLILGALMALTMLGTLAKISAQA